jgi:hypothetical protein
MIAKRKLMDRKELVEPYTKYNKSEVFKPSKDEAAIYSEDNCPARLCHRQDLGIEKRPEI